MYLLNINKRLVLTGGWVGREVLDHGSLHGWDSPATQDYSVYSNDAWKTWTQKARDDEDMWDCFKHMAVQY